MYGKWWYAVLYRMSRTLMSCCNFKYVMCLNVAYVAVCCSEFGSEAHLECTQSSGIDYVMHYCIECHIRCSVLQCVAVCCSMLQCTKSSVIDYVMHYCIECHIRCSVLQCVTVCCSARSQAASTMWCTTVLNVTYAAVCCSVLQFVAVFCSVLQYVAVHEVKRHRHCDEFTVLNVTYVAVV